MFELSKAAEERIKLHNKFGIRDESLKYLFEIVRLMYMEDEKDASGNVIKNPETGLPNQVPMRRKSGREACSHPYEVAYILWRCGLELKYPVTGLLHDIMEDTQYTEKDIRAVLEEFTKRYPDNLGCDSSQEFIEEVIDSLNRLTKKGDFGRPKEPDPPLKTKDGEILTLNDMKRRMYWRKLSGNSVQRRKVTILDLDGPSTLTWIRKSFNFKSYDKKMKNYITPIAEKHLAKIVKLADRTANLVDYKKEISSSWIEKYSRETGEYFVMGLVDDTVPKMLKNALFHALQNARRTRTVRKNAEIAGTKGLACPPAIINNEGIIQKQIDIEKEHE